MLVCRVRWELGAGSWKGVAGSGRALSRLVPCPPAGTAAGPNSYEVKIAEGAAVQVHIRPYAAAKPSVDEIAEVLPGA